MNTSVVRILVCAGCTFLLASCSPRQAEVTLNPEVTSPSSLLSRVSARGEQIRSLEGSGTVTFESPEMAGSAFFHVSLKKPDSLLLRLEGPFGIDAGFFFLESPDVRHVQSLRQLRHLRNAGRIRASAG